MKRHLLTVWNPLYTRDVDQHFTLLLHWARLAQEGKAPDDDVYVWWGKVKSPNRQQPLAHTADVRALAQSLESDDAPETHLYVTDYRSLYVGDLLDITEGELPADEHEHVPEYYRAKELKCDFWFRLADMRRLVSDDLPGVAEELRKLHNVHYHDKPVSLYGGMVDLPLVVTRPDGAEFFGVDDRRIASGDRLWVQYDLEMGSGVASVQRDLRENVMGEAAWSALESTARTCVAGAEKLYREHREDPAFDFSPVIGNLSKALEVQCNAVLRRAVAKLPVPLRSVRVRDTTVDLARASGLSLGELARVIGGDRELSEALSRLLEHGAWFTGQLPAVLDAFKEVRNPGTHAAHVDRDTAAHWRNRMLGVGCHGDLVQLAAVKLRRG